ncbi:MAG: hypothetical protein QM817_10275 [Archangium sp.]
MSAPPPIQLPFKPYAHQREAHAFLREWHERRMVAADAQLAGDEEVMRDAVHLLEESVCARFLVLVWHRRAGKTVFAVMELFLAALNCKLPRGRYAYIAPLLKQARTVAWDYLQQYARCIPGAVISQADLSVRLPNGAEVRLYGADNPDALRGIYLDGVVLDEVADMRPNVWGEIIRPALADRRGWAIFIGTPKGVNLFSELYFRAQKEKGWHADLRRADDTGVISKAELEQAKKEMTPAQYAQEFECDFAASVEDVLLRLDDVLGAQRREHLQASWQFAAKVLGVDVARYGGDRSCLFPRQGLIALKPAIYSGLNLMALSSKVAESHDRWKPDAVFVDQGGMGAGVIDRLRQLGIRAIGVDFGGAPTDPRFQNKRTEMWWEMADWVREGGGALPSGNDIVQDLTAPRYTFKNAAGRLALESKDSMRERGLRSPDVGDALALTFAAPVVPKEVKEQLQIRQELRPRGVAKSADYDPFASE